MLQSDRGWHYRQQPALGAGAADQRCRGAWQPGDPLGAGMHTSAHFSYDDILPGSVEQGSGDGHSRLHQSGGAMCAGRA
jgi:hypothetical protein